MLETLTSALMVVNQILNAGNAVTAFSLLLYSLTFNPKERTARILALLLGCLALVYATDVMAGTATLESEQQIWLRLQWAGISFGAAGYMHISDALLAATGRPSRGPRVSAMWRRWRRLPGSAPRSLPPGGRPAPRCSCSPSPSIPPRRFRPTRSARRRSVRASSSDP